MAGSRHEEGQILGDRQVNVSKAVNFSEVDSGKKFPSVDDIIDLKVYDSDVELSESIPPELWSVCLLNFLLAVHLHIPEIQKMNKL